MNSTTNLAGAWRLGVVSNCWRVQLENGTLLGTLVAEAVQRNLTVVELRQGSLGEFESSPSNVPDAGRLAILAHDFPEVLFNIAIAGPYLSGSVSRSDELFLAGRAAAMVLANGHLPHLRLVDLQTQPEQCSESSVESAACRLVELTDSMAEVGGILSVEHARQPWLWFDSVMTEARQRLGEHSSRLRLCFDPCNLLLTERAEDVSGIVEAVEPKDVSMIHVKQRSHGNVQPIVGDGDLDWPELLVALRRRGHTAPVLFEVAPHEEIWRNLDHAVGWVGTASQWRFA